MLEKLPNSLVYPFSLNSLKVKLNTILSKYLFKTFGSFKLQVAVYSNKTLSLLAIKMRLIVYSHVVSLAMSSLSLLEVKEFKWCASSAINTTFVFSKSSNVNPFSLLVNNSLCIPWTVLKAIQISSPYEV